MRQDSLNSMIRRIEINEQEVYELFIKMYIKKGLIRESLPLIRESIEMNEKYDIITILILIFHLL